MHNLNFLRGSSLSVRNSELKAGPILSFRTKRREALQSTGCFSNIVFQEIPTGA